MIYLDNGATTYPKPRSVINAVNNAFVNGANPGRGGHNLAMRASELRYSARSTAAEFFGCDDPSRVIFTLNCTTALNTVIKGVLKEGDHVVISSYEHNAVLRPLEKLKERDISYTVARVADGDDEQTLMNFRSAIQSNTKLLVCTHASNVFGVRLPVERLCALFREYGILTCVDSAQTAGIVPIDLKGSAINYLCFAGHKGLYGPMGTGGFVINCGRIPDSLTEGGTGSNSEQSAQPPILPDKFESGTPNLAGIAGLKSGIDFVNSNGIDKTGEREMQLIRNAYKALEKFPHVKLYTELPDSEKNVPVLSFNIDGRDSEEVSEILNKRYNIAVRAGLHCAMLAHKSKNTLNTGTVRIVPSVFSTENDIMRLCSAVYNIK